MADRTRCWFFGCWSPERIEHDLFAPRELSVQHCLAGESWTFDCGYAPGCGNTRRGIASVSRPRKPHPSELPQTLGVWHRTVVNGCTVIACWDRSADSRRNSNAAFIVEGEHDIATALAIARQHFPDQVARILTQFEEPTQVENG